MTQNSSYIPASDVLGVSLVGGEGTRLGPLTWYRTKGAVMAGPSILSAFSTSNAFNSGIEKIIMAVQYLPYSLEYFYSQVHNEDFGHRKKISVLNPFHFQNLRSGFKGTADAFFYALQRADKSSQAYPQEYVLGLSGDHIYRCDFTELFNIFNQKYGDNSLVVFTQEVRRETASEFGILTTEPNSTRVTSFKEKPKQHELPEGQENFKASLGIYFASRALWRDALNIDQERGKSELSRFDIGGNVIPYLVENQSRFQVHTFNLKEQWADVGKPRAYFDTMVNMFLERNPDLFGDPKWKIEALGTPVWNSSGQERYVCCLEHTTIRKSNLNNVVCSPGMVISNSTASNSIFLGGSEDEKTHINGSHLENVIIDKECNISPKSVVLSKNGLVMIAKETHIPSGTIIEAKGMAVVASITEMEHNLNNLKTFVQKQKEEGEEVELFTPEGILISMEEIMAKSEDKEIN